MRTVKNASDWKKMAGDNELEKRLNSYLTCQFIVKHDIPADECLSEARFIIAFVKEYRYTFDDAMKGIKKMQKICKKKKIKFSEEE